MFSFQGFCLDFQSFAVAYKPFQNTYFPEHLSMAASVCVEIGLLKLKTIFSLKWPEKLLFLEKIL